MKTSGHGDDSWMSVLTLGVTAVVGTILFGGPSDALEAVDALVGDIVGETLQFVSAWFS
jgi:hypothetical protein